MRHVSIIIAFHFWVVGFVSTTDWHHEAQKQNSYRSSSTLLVCKFEKRIKEATNGEEKIRQKQKCRKHFIARRHDCMMFSRDDENCYSRRQAAQDCGNINWPIRTLMFFIVHFSSSKSSPRLSGGGGNLFVFQRGEDAFKNPFAVVAAEQRFASAFGMWH